MSFVNGITQNLVQYLQYFFDNFLTRFEKFITGGNFDSLYMVLFVLLIDFVALGYKKSAVYNLLHPTKSTWYDIAIFICSLTGVMWALKVMSTGGLGLIIPKSIKNYLLPLDLTIQFANPLVHFIVVLLMVDFIDYWRHRFAHQWKWWWNTHIFHHSATEFNVITVGRSHPLDLALRKIMMYFPIFIVGKPVETFIAIQLAKSFQGKIQHSMVDWNWGFIGKYIFISPVDHRIHHSTLDEHWDKNFGHLTPLWDRLFGTWYDGETVNKTIGVQNNPHNKRGVFIDLCAGEFHAIKGFGTALVQRIKSTTQIFRGGGTAGQNQET